MGNYINIGIATQILIEKEMAGPQNKKLTADEILDRIDTVIDLDMYHIREDSDFVGLEIREDDLEKYLYSFLRAQSYDLKCGKEMRKDLAKMKEKDGHEIIQMVRNCEFEFLYYSDKDYRRVTYLDEELKMRIVGISYLSDGKVVIESYFELFKYIHRLIRKSSKNPIRNVTYLSIV